MAAVCPNCHAKLGCSCKLRTASNGTTCCTNCIDAYEASLLQKVKTILKKTVKSKYLTHVLI